MKIREFKKLVANWPEFNTRTGELAEVWLETENGLSSPLKHIYTLNMSGDGSSDQLLSSESNITITETSSGFTTYDTSQGGCAFCGKVGCFQQCMGGQ